MFAIIIFLGGYLIYDKMANGKTNSDDSNDIVEVKSKEYELNEANETHSFEGLNMSFKGTDGGNDDYEYILETKYNGTVIDTSFLDNKIWSSNRASHFNVYKIGNIFVLDSFRAAQCNDDTIMIINTKGKVLKTYESISLKVEDTRINVTKNDCFNSDSSESYVYEVNGYSLKEIK